MVIHDPTLKRTTGRRGRSPTRPPWSPDAREGGPGWYGRRQSRGWRSCSRSARSSTATGMKSASRNARARTVTRIRGADRALRQPRQGHRHQRFADRAQGPQRTDPGAVARAVAEYAWLDPLKVAQHYGCALLALNRTLCTPERLLGPAPGPSRLGVDGQRTGADAPARRLGVDNLTFPVWPAPPSGIAEHPPAGSGRRPESFKAG